jgi:hypothetical protein
MAKKYCSTWEGDLIQGVHISSGLVVIRFIQAVRWLALNQEELTFLIQVLNERLLELKATTAQIPDSR